MPAVDVSGECVFVLSCIAVGTRHFCLPTSLSEGKSVGPLFLGSGTTRC